MVRAAIILAMSFFMGLAAGLPTSIKVARACSCPTPPPPAQSLQSSTAVFDGTVVRVEMVNPRDQRSDLRVFFVVHTQWKGVTSGRVVLTTPGNSAMCGVYFGLGLRYLVYAGGTSDNLVAWSCNRSREYDAEEAAALGPDSPPPGAEPYVGKWDQTPPTTGCPRCAAPPAPRAAMAAAAAVFHGRPVGLTYLGPDGDFNHVMTFLNLGWWKGPDTPTIDVRLPRSFWYCERSMFGDDGGVGSADDYLIYADADAGGTLVLKLCDRTKPYDAAEAAELGTPNAPRPDQGTGTPGPSATPTPGTPQPNRTPTRTPTLNPQPCPTLECPPCAPPRPAAEWLAESDAVFRGRVTAVEPAGCDHRVRFAVDEVWKGPLVAQHSVWVGTMTWQCTRRFAVGDEGVVFAKADAAGGLVIPLCFGNASGDPGADLGPGTPIGPDAPVPPVGHVGGRIRAIAVDPDLPGIGWIAQGRTVAAVELPPDGAPRLLGQALVLADPVMDLAVDPPRAVALTGRRLVRLDISDPARPRVLGGQDIDGLGEQLGPVVLSGDLAVVGLDGPSSPAGVVYVDMITGERHADIVPTGLAILTDVIRAGDRVVLASRSDLHAASPGLAQILSLAIDHSAPNHGLQELGRIEDPAIETLAYAQVSDADSVYALGPGGIAGWDVSDPASPREVKRWPASWRPEGAAPEAGNIAVTPEGEVFAALHQWIGSFYTAGMVVRVLDAPNAIGQWTERAHWTIRPLDAKLVAHTDGLLMAEATGLGRYDTAAGETSMLGLVVDAVDVAASDTRGGAAPADGDPALFVLNGLSSLAMLGLGDPLVPDLRWALTDSSVRGGLSVSGGVASMASYGATDIHDQALEVMDVSSGEPPNGPASRLRLLEGGAGLRYDQSGRRLVVRTRPDTIALYDLSDPAAPVERDSVNFVSRQISDVAVDGDRVVVASYNRVNPGPDDPVQVLLSTLSIEGAGETLQLTPHAEIMVKQHAVVDWTLPRVAIAGDVAWVVLAIHCPGNPRYMLHGIDISDLIWVKSIPWGWEDLRERPADIVAAEGHVFLPGEQTWILDVRNPRLPAWAGRLGTASDSVAVLGRTVYIAEGEDGVGVYRPDLAWSSDPNIPTPTPEVRPSSIPPTATPDCRPTATPGGSGTDTPTPATPATGTPPATPTPGRGGVYLPWLGREG